MKYRFMESYGTGFTVEKMCRALRVDRSGYYAYLRRGLGKRHEENERLLRKIKEIWRWS